MNDDLFQVYIDSIAGALAVPILMMVIGWQETSNRESICGADVWTCQRLLDIRVDRAESVAAAK